MKDKILKIIDNKEKSYTFFELKDLLGLSTTEEIEVLASELSNLEENLIIYRTNKNKYVLVENSHLIKGKIDVSDKGYGFILMEGEDDIHVSNKYLNGAKDGDLVIAEIIASPKKGKKEGKVLRIKSKDFGIIIGEVTKENNELKIINKDRKNKYNIILDKKDHKNLVEGHIILLEAIKQTDNNNILCKKIKVVGHKNDVGVDVLSIIYKYMFEPNFSSDVLEEADRLPESVSENDIIGRKDLRSEVIFTIDGDDTKDIDDAISIKKINDDLYELGVHIADVSYYVKPGSKLYEEAYKRATSVYLVDRVIPMLPHKLSNGICSLNPKVDRLSVSCVMKINNKGKVLSYDIFESVINSKIQMTYNKVNDYLEKNIIHDDYKPFTQDLSLMLELSNILRKSREVRGAIDFDTKEAKILVDDKGIPNNVVLRNRGLGEKMIEDFMIVANETVASCIYYMNLPFVYRVHGIPSEEKVNDFMNFINTLGYKVNGKININYPSSIQNILNCLKDKEEYEILSQLMLRCMKKAVYQTDNIGHFGLASKIYTHFTSPIRRFPDTTVHRLLRTYLFEKNQEKQTTDYYNTYLIPLCEHASLKEKDAIDCERDVESMKMAEYMENHIGEEYYGIINSIMPFGMFIELPNKIEGLVHISEIDNDYYNYDDKTMQLYGQKRKNRFKIGQKVKIRVKSASKDESYIDFELIKEGEENEKEKEVETLG